MQACCWGRQACSPELIGCCRGGGTTSRHGVETGGVVRTGGRVDTVVKSGIGAHDVGAWGSSYAHAGAKRRSGAAAVSRGGGYKFQGHEAAAQGSCLGNRPRWPVLVLAHAEQRRLLGGKAPQSALVQWRQRLVSAHTARGATSARVAENDPGAPAHRCCCQLVLCGEAGTASSFLPALPAGGLLLSPRETSGSCSTGG